MSGDQGCAAAVVPKKTLPFSPIVQLEDYYGQTVVNLDISQSLTVFAKAADKLFDMVKSNKVKIDIYKKYHLKDVVVAHQDLEARKIIGPAIIVP